MTRLVWLLVALVLLPAVGWAAPSTTLLTADCNPADQNSYATASVAPTANRLVLVWIYAVAASDNTNPTVTGNSLDYDEVDFREAGTSPSRRIYLQRSLGASPSAGAITIDFAGITQTGICWIVEEWANVDTSGTNGSGAIVQSVDDQLLDTELTLTLAAFSSSNNRPAGAMGATAAEAITQEAGWTTTGQLSDAGVGSFELAWKDATDDTSLTLTGTANTTRVGVIVEIKAATVRRGPLLRGAP